MPLPQTGVLATAVQIPPGPRTSVMLFPRDSRPLPPSRVPQSVCMLNRNCIRVCDSPRSYQDLPAWTAYSLPDMVDGASPFGFPSRLLGGSIRRVLHPDTPPPPELWTTEQRTDSGPTPERWTNHLHCALHADVWPSRLTFGARDRCTATGRASYRADLTGFGFDGMVQLDVCGTGSLRQTNLNLAILRAHVCPTCFVFLTYLVVPNWWYVQTGGRYRTPRRPLKLLPSNVVEQTRGTFVTTQALLPPGGDGTSNGRAFLRICAGPNLFGKTLPPTLLFVLPPPAWRCGVVQATAR